MKTIRRITATVILLAAFVASAFACEITYEILKGEKASYAVGDELIVRVKVEFTHRVCPEGIKATEFKLDGLKVVGAKEWEEHSPTSYSRDLKIKITEGGKEVKLISKRTCDKDGGFGSISFKAE